jgi:hypothetical protein
MKEEEIKQKLLKNKQLNWGECNILEEKNKPHYVKEYRLQCPYCSIGEITFIDDSTPGFREHDFIPCKNCGLDGRGYTLYLDTVKKRKETE